MKKGALKIRICILLILALIITPVLPAGADETTVDDLATGDLINDKVDTASDEIIIYVGEVTVSAGNNVSVPISVSGNTGIGGLAMTVSSDSAITLTSIERGELLSSEAMAKETFNTDTQAGFIQWYTSKDPVKGDGELFVLKFNVKQGTKEGSYPVNIDFKDGIKANITDENGVTLNVTLKSSNVLVKSGLSRKKGDLTGDGDIAMGDVVMLARAVAGKITLTDEQKIAADVTGDGDFAMGDVVKLARYVAGDIKEL